MIKVLAVTNLYPTEDQPGDTPSIKDQLDSLAAMGVDIDLLHIRRDKRWNYVAAAWKIFLLNFKPRKYDLLHAYYGHSGLAALCQFRVPVVITYLGSDLLHPREKYLGKITSRLASEIIVMSGEMKTASGRADAHVIPAGINTRIFEPIPKHIAREELSLPASTKLILFPWNPSRPVKRFDIVSDAVRILQGSMDVEIISIHEKTPQETAWYMNACDVMILASDHEGSPVVVREAMACNLPVVAVDVGDVREVLLPVHNCMITERTPAALAQASAMILQSGERSDGSRFAQNDNADASAAKVLDVYFNALGESEFNTA